MGIVGNDTQHAIGIDPSRSVRSDADADVHHLLVLGGSLQNSCNGRKVKLVGVDGLDVLPVHVSADAPQIAVSGIHGDVECIRAVPDPVGCDRQDGGLGICEEC